MTQPNELRSSTPTFFEFDPSIIPYQGEVIDDIYHEYDYGLGSHEILLSGSVGSAKSILMAHLVVRHCTENVGARVLLGRKALPDLKDTIFVKVLEHLGESFVEGKDYFINHTSARISFRNGSQIISRSWSDKKYKKMRSLELSMAVIEELTENDDKDKEAYDEIVMRVGRLPHIKQNYVICASNPDAPSHWAYKYFIAQPDHPTRHTYYSVTTDNPFLPAQYIEKLKANLDPKMAERMIYGRWIEIRGETVYYAYERELQFRNHFYEMNPKHPVILTWDFNIGEGKPMSMAVMQYIDDEFHIFDEVVVNGGRTADTLDELDGKGLLHPDWKYIVCGDAAGKHRDTRSNRSDYDIILQDLRKRGLHVEFHVPPGNPPVRLRHNRVNAYCKNDLGKRRIFIYKNAPTVDEALRLTKLKKGAGYIEDDSKSYQHIGTAIGYAIVFETTNVARKPQGTVLF